MDRVDRLEEPASWAVTTTALWCPEVEQRVILIVKGDWSAFCVWHRERLAQGDDPGRCMGERCHHLGNYRRKLVEEELSIVSDVRGVVR